MRQIGSISETSQASRFGAYLATEGIPCSIDQTPSGHVIWVHDEDRVAQAKDELARFRQEPDHERYRDAEERARQASAEQQQKSTAIRSRTIDLRTRWVQPSIDQCPVTFALMALIVFIAIMLGSDPSRREMFVSRMVFSPDRTTEAIRSGEVWRLISPILVHKDHFHLFFNLLVLYGFGLKVESQLRPPRFFLLVLVVAILSNYAQFLAVGGRFYGMSGVNYGIFGYAWIRSRLDANSGIFVTRENVVMMLAWAIMCVLFIPGIANWSHGAGLATGAAIGAASAFAARPRL